MKKVEIDTASVFIGGKEYVPKETVQTLAVDTNGLPFVMVRTYSAGVHFGYLKRKESTLAGMEVTLVKAQRMRELAGAMDLSQLATEGSTKPSECKPSVVVPSIDLVAIEIIPITDVAAANIATMPIWKV